MKEHVAPDETKTKLLNSLLKKVPPHLHLKISLLNCIMSCIISYHIIFIAVVLAKLVEKYVGVGCAVQQDCAKCSPNTA